MINIELSRKMAKLNGIDKMSYGGAFTGVRPDEVLPEKQFDQLNSRNTDNRELRQPVF